MANKQSDLSSLPRSRAEAQNLGLDRFFTGMPCIHGHIAARHASTTNCVQCQVEHARRNGGWKARPSKEEFLQMARELVEGKGGELLSTEYVSAKSKLEVGCSVQAPAGHSSSRIAAHGRFCGVGGGLRTGLPAGWSLLGGLQGQSSRSRQHRRRGGPGRRRRAPIGAGAST